MVPAGLPFLNCWPWTGWRVVDEFDLLLVGSLAAGYARLAWESRSVAMTVTRAPIGARKPWVTLLLVLITATATASLVRGLIAAGVLEAGFDWTLAPTQAMAYESPLNWLLIFKSLGFAVLLFPLLGRQMLAR